MEIEKEAFTKKKSQLPVFYSPEPKLRVIEKDFRHLFNKVTRKKFYMQKKKAFFENKFLTLFDKKNPSVVNSSHNNENSEVIQIESECISEGGIRTRREDYKPVRVILKPENENEEDNLFFNREPRNHQNPPFRDKNLQDVEKLLSYREIFTLETQRKLLEETPIISPIQKKAKSPQFQNQTRFDYKENIEFHNEVSLESRSYSAMEEKIYKKNFFQSQRTKIRAVNEIIRARLRRNNPNKCKSTTDSNALFNSRRRKTHKFDTNCSSASHKLQLDVDIEKPNYKNLQKYLKENYLKKDWITKNKFWKSIFHGSTIAAFTCCRITRNPYDKAGSGMNLFFNFLKTTIYLFFVYFLITFPLQLTNASLYAISKHPNLKHSGDTLLEKIYSSLTPTTMAASASFNQVFYEYSFRDDQQMHVSCEYGFVSIDPDWTKFGFVSKKKSLEELSFSIDDECTDYKNVVKSMKGCLGMKYCKVNFEKNWVKEECRDKIQDFKGVLAVYCKNVLLKIWEIEPKSLVKIYTMNAACCAFVPIFLFYYFLL